MTIPNDTLLFCPFDGQKITMANDTACCPIHGYFTAIFEEWAQLANSVRYEYQGELLRFTDEKAIVELLSRDVSDDEPEPDEVPADEIKKPSHYNQYKGFEVMDVCRQLVSPDATPASTWFRGNVFKYLARAGWKPGDGKELQDLEKASEYLRKELERVKTRDDFLNKDMDEGIQAMRKYLGGVKNEAEIWMEAGADPTPTLSGGDFRHDVKKPKFVATCGNEGCIEHTEEVQ